MTSIKRIITVVLFILFAITSIVIGSFVDKSIDTIEDNEIKDDTNNSKEYKTLFDDTVKKSITIQFTEEDWDKLVSENISVFKSNYYAMATLIYEDSIGNLIIEDKVGIRTKGNNYSRVVPEEEDGNLVLSHFKLKFNETFDLSKSSNNYKILNDRQVFSLDGLELKYNRNGLWGEHPDYTFISESHAFKLFREIDIVAPRASNAMFYIKIGNRDIVNYGLYTILEPIDDKFIDKNFKFKANEKGDLYKGRWSANLGPIIPDQFDYHVGVSDWTRDYRPPYSIRTNKDTTEHEALIELTKLLQKKSRMDENEFIEAIEDKVDMESWIKYLAMAFLIGNHDDYRHNQNNSFFYFHTDGKMYYIPYDFDHSFGQGWGGEYEDFGVNNHIFIGLPNYQRKTMNVKTPLADKILEIEKYKDMYVNYLIEYTSEDGVFNFDDFNKHYNIIKDLYERENLNSMSPNTFDTIHAKWWYEEKKLNTIKWINKQ